MTFPGDFASIVIYEFYQKRKWYFKVLLKFSEDSESTALYKQQYQKLVDGYGLMGILRLNNGYLWLLLSLIFYYVNSIFNYLLKKPSQIRAINAMCLY